MISFSYVCLGGWGPKPKCSNCLGEIRESEMFDVCTEGVCLVIPTWLGGSYQVASSHAKR